MREGRWPRIFGLECFKIKAFNRIPTPAVSIERTESAAMPRHARDPQALRAPGRPAMLHGGWGSVRLELCHFVAGSSSGPTARPDAERGNAARRSTRGVRRGRVLRGRGRALPAAGRVAFPPWREALGRVDVEPACGDLQLAVRAGS